MFDTGVDLSPLNVNNLWSQLSWDQRSYVPMVGSNLSNNNFGGSVVDAAAVIPAVGGIGYSYWSKNPGSVSHDIHTSWFDDRMFWLNGAKPNDPNAGDGTFWMANAFVPRTPGDYAANTSNPQTAFFEGNVPGILGTGPGWIGNTPVQTIVINDSSQITRVGYYDYLHGLVQMDFANWQLPYPFAQQGTNIIFVPNRAPLSGGVRNVLYISGGASAQNKIIAWSIVGSTLDIAFADTVNIDNLFLDNIWQNNGNLGLSIWYGGYVIALGTGGAGPTGQLNEYLITDPFMLTYQLVKFVPMDAYSDAVLSLTGVTQSMQIDTDGIIWLGPASLTPGFNSRAIYSFSKNRLTPPTIQNPILGPIVLPCWNNCNPVLTL